MKPGNILGLADRFEGGSPINGKNDQDKQLLIDWIMDAGWRSVVHYGLWFKEVEYQFGLKFALEVEKEAGDRSFSIQLKRLAKVLGFELINGAPEALYRMPEEELHQLLDAICANWVTNDGVWFQTVEKKLGLSDAQRVNDTCWSRFSPLEASRIKAMLELPENGGLSALKTALGYRLYTRINQFRVVDEGPETMTLQMVECRVQWARQRKGLADYPCKSAGLVEYRTFARTIDSRISTECLACPPDETSPDWFCAWRFRLVN